MKVHLFNDKQVRNIVNSIERDFSKQFKTEVTKREGMLDTEVKRQIESNEEILKIKTKRDADIAKITKASALLSKVKSIDEEYNITYASGWRAHDVPNKEEIVDFTKEFNEHTNDLMKGKATKAAEAVLGLNNNSYRKQCLFDDITARVTVMAVTGYDDIVKILNEQIKIEDYFITL